MLMVSASSPLPRRSLIDWLPATTMSAPARRSGGTSPRMPASSNAPVAVIRATAAAIVMSTPTKLGQRARKVGMARYSMAQPSRWVMRSATASAVGAAMWCTIRPSARNSTPSAWDAASGSCVTMTMVSCVPIGALAHQVEDLGAGARVERAGGLVREQDVGSHHQRAGDGHPLLLSAGQLRRPVFEAVGETDAIGDLGQPGAVGTAAAEACAAARCSAPRSVTASGCRPGR